MSMTGIVTEEGTSISVLAFPSRSQFSLAIGDHDAVILTQREVVALANRLLLCLLGEGA